MIQCNIRDITARSQLERTTQVQSQALADLHRRKADCSLERSEGGLGIGLCLVQRLVELHGGTVEAKSAGLGHGSEFTVRLWMQPPTAPSGACSTPTAAAAMSKRVLVVDDNVDIADSTALLLEKFGHEVKTAHTGRPPWKWPTRFCPS